MITYLTQGQNVCDLNQDMGEVFRFRYFLHSRLRTSHKGILLSLG